jgi:hypothetical protein
VSCRTGCWGSAGGGGQRVVLMTGAGSGILKDMETGGRPDRGVYAADVHYLGDRRRPGGSRAGR